MAKTIFEEMGGTYTQGRGLSSPRSEAAPRRTAAHRRVGTAPPALPERASTGNLCHPVHQRQIEQLPCRHRPASRGDVFRLVKQMAEAEGVTETLKATAPMEWVCRMNNIRSRAMEIVNSELIYRV